ncbi:MAG: phosphatase PAP2 family protein [Armatimonadota bacterium]
MPFRRPQTVLLVFGLLLLETSHLWGADTTSSPPSSAKAGQVSPQAHSPRSVWGAPKPSAGFLLTTAALIAIDGSSIDALGKDKPNPEGVERLRKSGFRDAWYTAGALALVWVADAYSGRSGARTALNAFAQATLVSESLKHLTGRERPFDAGDHTVFRGPFQGHHSFPSGHATAAFAIAGAVGHCYPDAKGWLYLGAALVGLSRIKSGFHYPSDVFVGAGIGLSSARRASGGGGWIRFRF